MIFDELSDWIDDGHCSYRIVKGGNPDNPKDRVAFIEKTPRVRISKYTYAVENDNGIGAMGMKNDAWLSVNKRCGHELGNYRPSRDWCDQILSLLGWT